MLFPLSRFQSIRRNPASFAACITPSCRRYPRSKRLTVFLIALTGTQPDRHHPSFCPSPFAGYPLCTAPFVNSALISSWPGTTLAGPQVKLFLTAIFSLRPRPRTFRFSTFPHCSESFDRTSLQHSLTAIFYFFPVRPAVPRFWLRLRHLSLLLAFNGL